MHFEILGEPIGEGRPRAVRVGAGVRMHSPKRSSEWRALAAQQMAAEKGATIDGAAWVKIAAIMPRPKLPKKAGTGRLWRACGADIDNICKAVLDAMVTAGVIANDRAVVSLTACKVTAAVGELPRVTVDVGPWLA